MTVFEIYSKRARKARGDAPNQNQHIEMPRELRVQITKIWDDAIGLRPQPHRPNPLYGKIVRDLCTEYGLRKLHDGGKMSKREELREWFLAEPDMERCLDAVEVSFRLIDGLVRRFYPSVSWRAVIDLSPDEAIAELNRRMKEAGVGFQWQAGFIVPVDGSAKLTHWWSRVRMKLFRGRYPRNTREIEDTARKAPR